MARPNEALTPGRRAWVYPDRKSQNAIVHLFPLPTERKDTSIVDLGLNKRSLVEVAVIDALKFQVWWKKSGPRTS